MNTKGKKFRHGFLGLTIVSLCGIAGAATTFGVVKDIHQATSSPQSLFSGDVDGDGDNDLIVGSILDNKISWFENLNGSGSFGPEQVITTFANGVVSVAVADLDGDLDNDLLAASQNGNTISWYENINGSDAFSSPVVLSSTAMAAVSVIPADVDGDTDIDIVAASTGDNSIVWFENIDGSNAFSGANTISSSANGVVSIYVADLDKDTDLDIVSALFADNTIAWFENTDGDGTFGGKQTISSSVPGIVSVYAADLDADTNIDVFAASAFNDEVLVFENTNGNGSFGSQQSIVQNVNGVYSIAAIDIDGDMDSDLVTTSLIDGELSWHENQNGSGSFGPPNVLSTQSNQATFAIASKIDSDTSNDIFFASNDTNEISWINNQLVAPPPAIDVVTAPDPELTVDFGTFVIDSPTVTKSVTIQNVGELDLVTATILANNGGGDFTLATTPDSTLRALESDTFEVSFSPSVHGPITGIVEIDTNTSSGTVTVNLIGNGLDQVRPTIDMDAVPDYIATTRITNYRVRFSEPVTSFSQFDWETEGVVVTNIQGLGPEYSLQLDFTDGDGPKSFTYRQDTAFDIAGNGNSASQTISTVVDTIPPTLDMDPLPAVVGSTRITDYRVRFSEPVTSFSQFDWDTQGVTVSNIQGLGPEYSLQLDLSGGDGPKSFTYRPNTAFDVAGNGNLISETKSFELDTTPPTVELGSVPANTNTPDLSDITVTFSEPVTGLEVADFQTSGVVVSNIRGSDENYLIDLTLEIGNGDKQVFLRENTVQDAAGNLNEVSNTLQTNLDASFPLVDLADLPQFTNNRIIEDFEISFSEPVTGLEVSDFLTTGITVSNLEGNVDQYVIDLELTGNDGLKEIALAANSVEDISLNGNRLTEVVSTTLDTTSPIALLEVLPAYLNEDSVIGYEVAFTESVTGLEESDFLTTGFIVTNLNGSGTSYTIDLELTGNDGLKEIALDANSVQDNSTNENQLSSIVSTTLDTVSPIAMLEVLPAFLNEDNFFNYEVTFTKDITGLEISDFLTSGITVSNLQGTGSFYTIDLMFSEADGINVIMVEEDSVIDIAGNTNSASQVESVVIDRIAPTVTLDSLPSITNEPTVTGYSVTFSEPVSTLEVEDFNMFGLSITSLSGSDDAYTVDFLLEPPDGSKGFNLITGSVVDRAGNVFQGSEVVGTVLDRTSPGIILDIIPVVATTGDAITDFGVRFSEEIVGLELSDFTTTGVVVSNLSGSGSQYTVDLAFDGPDGTKSFFLDAGTVEDLAGNPNIASSVASVELITTVPEPTLDELPMLTSSSTLTSYTLEFDEPISGLSIDDFATTGITVTDLSANSETEFTMNLEFVGGDGTKDIMLPSNVVQNIAGTQNTASETKSTLLDQTAPESMAFLSAASQDIGTINGTYTVVEEGSGLVEVLLFVREPNSAEFVNAGAVTNGTFSYTPQQTGNEAAGTYFFYTLGTDNVSNEETPPASPEGDASIELTIPQSGNFWVIQ